MLNNEEKVVARQKLENTTPIKAEVGVIKAGNGLTARKAAEKWADNHLNKPLEYDTEAGMVVFDKTSVKNSLAHGYGQVKLDAIPTLPKGFVGAIYLGSLQDKNRPNTINHFFAYPIDYDGKLRYVFCRALEDNMNNRLYVHEVFIADRLKEDKTKGNALQTEDSALSVNQNGGIALYRNILSDVLNANIQQDSESTSTNAENISQKDAEYLQAVESGDMEKAQRMVIEAAKKSHAHSFIKRLPNGYDTLIGEDGGMLSQGQKQLLCITRVMLHVPPMLILDEATSSIDTRTEMRIQRAFHKMMEGRTSFIVAHRLSTIREADRILVMKDGHIIEQGDHEELLSKGGFYSQLYKSQFEQ